MSDTFCKAPHSLLQAHHFLSLTTRQPVALSAQDKILWVFMKDRHDYFTGEGKLWFDNQTDIASACGCSLTAAKAFIAKLRQHGYLTIEKRRIHGCAHSNSMVITRDLILAPVAPLDAISKPVPITPNPSRERVPEYAPVALPRLSQTPLAPSVTAYAADFDDQPEWMRDVA